MTFFNDLQQGPNKNSAAKEALPVPKCPRGFIAVTGIHFATSKDVHPAARVVTPNEARGYMNCGWWVFNVAHVGAVYETAYHVFAHDGTPVLTRSTTLDLANGERVTCADSVTEVLAKLADSVK